jgi:solute carrier family 25 carnitine/acylcarnitine transporter 20/29
MSQERRKHRTNFQNIMVDILSGTIAGINVTLVGHPFDTLKVRLQTQPHNNPIYSGVVDCVQKTIKWEGFAGLYKGVQSPLIGQMFFRANTFFAFGESKRYLAKYGQRKLEIIDYFKAGAMAWAWSTLAECPIDFFKTQMQIQIIKAKTIPNYKPEYDGILDCFKKIMKNNGILGAYQGIVPHITRNLLGGSVHLGSFEWVRLIYAEKYKCDVRELPVWCNLLGGSIGGFLFWFLFYPIDVVKSSIQGDSPFKNQKKYNGVADVVTKLWGEGGWKRFYKGFSPCMMRAIPANAVLLFTSSFISENL